MHIHFYAYSFLCNAYSFLCIFITMHIHFYAYSFLCNAYSFLCIFISMHNHRHEYSHRSVYISYSLSHTQTEIHRQGTDRHRQIHTSIQLHRYVYRRYYGTEYRLYVTTDYLVDSSINSMIVESFVVVITRIAKQYFTRL